MAVYRAMTQMFVSQQLVLVLSAIAMVTLARLLSPEDFGAFATALTIFAFLETLARFGLEHFIISAKKLDKGTPAAALGLSFAIGLGITCLLIIAVLTPLPQLLPNQVFVLLLIMAPGLAAGAFIQVPQALLQRDIDFSILARLSVFRILADLIVALTLASLGAGAAALAGGVLADRVFSAVLLNARPERRIRPSRHGWAQFFAFGRQMTLTNLLPKVADLGIALIIPVALGLGAMGLFNRARAIVNMLNTALLDSISPVVLPAFTNALRNDTAVADIYQAKTARLSVICWPVFAVLALVAEPATLTLLGGQWLDAVPLVQILCLMGAVQPFTGMSMKFFTAVQLVPAYMRIQLVHQVVRFVLVALAAWHSLLAVGLALVVASVIKTLLIRSRLHRVIGPDRDGQRRRLYGKALFVTMTSLIGPLVLTWAFPELPATAKFGASFLAAAIGWFSGIAITGHPIVHDLRTILAQKLNEPQS